MFAATYPVVNRLSGGIAFNSVRREPPLRPRPLLAQQGGAHTVNLDALLTSFYQHPDCVDKIMIRYGKESLDTLSGKVVAAVSSTPIKTVDLTPQEMTIMQEVRACLKESAGGFSWTPIIVIGGFLGLAVLIAQPWSR